LGGWGGGVTNQFLSTVFATQVRPVSPQGTRRKQEASCPIALYPGSTSRNVFFREAPPSEKLFWKSLALVSSKLAKGLTPLGVFPNDWGPPANPRNGTTQTVLIPGRNSFAARSKTRTAGWLWGGGGFFFTKLVTVPVRNAIFAFGEPCTASARAKPGRASSGTRLPISCRVPPAHRPANAYNRKIELEREVSPLARSIDLSAGAPRHSRWGAIRPSSSFFFFLFSRK